VHLMLVLVLVALILARQEGYLVVDVEGPTERWATLKDGSAVKLCGEALPAPALSPIPRV
jgi:hypothetical protein